MELVHGVPSTQMTASDQIHLVGRRAERLELFWCRSQAIPARPTQKGSPSTATLKAIQRHITLYDGSRWAR